MTLIHGRRFFRLRWHDIRLRHVILFFSFDIADASIGFVIDVSDTRPAPDGFVILSIELAAASISRSLLLRRCI